MSGLYNLVLGDGHEYERGGFMLALLGLKGSDVGRFRDAWLEKDPDRDGEVRIAVYTRNGGGNRGTYSDVTEGLRSHACFLFDRDDTFDCTYATYYFALPTEDPGYGDAQEWAMVRGHIVAAAGPAIDTDKRWADAIERLR